MKCPHCDFEFKRSKDAWLKYFCPNCKGQIKWLDRPKDTVLYCNWMGVRLIKNENKTN